MYMSYCMPRFSKHFRVSKNPQSGTGKLSQWIQILTAKFEDLSLILETELMEENI